MWSPSPSIGMNQSKRGTGRCRDACMRSPAPGLARSISTDLTVAWSERHVHRVLGVEPFRVSGCARQGIIGRGDAPGETCGVVDSRTRGPYALLTVIARQQEILGVGFQAARSDSAPALGKPL